MVEFYRMFPKPMKNEDIVLRANDDGSYELQYKTMLGDEKEQSKATVTVHNLIISISTSIDFEVDKTCANLDMHLESNFCGENGAIYDVTISDKELENYLFLRR